MMMESNFLFWSEESAPAFVDQKNFGVVYLHLQNLHAWHFERIDSGQQLLAFVVKCYNQLFFVTYSNREIVILCNISVPTYTVYLLKK